MESSAADRLRTFLADPARPEGTLTYHELQGFLFAVACAPELVRPSDWLPIVFNEREAEYASMEEAQAILRDVMDLYNEITASARSEHPALPQDCAVRSVPVDNFADEAPLSRWSRGFVSGHEWLGDLWDVDLPDGLDEELGAVLLALSFFASPKIAEQFLMEIRPSSTLEVESAKVAEVFPEALGGYAYWGRLLERAYDEAAHTPITVDKTGRNDPCPCGSGKKFKKCCGSTPPSQ